MGIFEDNNRKYANAFTRMREKRGISLQDVSKRSGIAASTLTRTLQGTTGTPMATYEILVTQGLGATMYEFVDEIYGPVPQGAEAPTQRYTAVVRLLLAEIINVLQSDRLSRGLPAMPCDKQVLTETLHR